MEIPNRRQLETGYAVRMEQLTKKHRRELVRLLGSPPDPSKVPESFWQEVRDEMERENATLLLLLFLASARYHAFGSVKEPTTQSNIGDTLQSEAERYGNERSREVADSYATTSRERFQTFADEVRTIQTAPASTTVDPPTIPNNAPPIPTVRRLPDLTPEERERITRGFDKVFGKGRAKSIAITETTQAQSAGGDAGVRHTFGTSLGDLWITENDARVCPICSPLHRTRREFWGLKYVNGPPAHPNCRCVVAYVNVPANRGKAAAITEAFADPEFLATRTTV